MIQNNVSLRIYIQIYIFGYCKKTDAYIYYSMMAMREAMHQGVTVVSVVVPKQEKSKSRSGSTLVCFTTKTINVSGNSISNTFLFWQLMIIDTPTSCSFVKELCRHNS